MTEDYWESEPIKNKAVAEWAAVNYKKGSSMTNEGQPGLPKDYTITSRFEVDGQLYEVKVDVTREFLTDAVNPGSNVVAALDLVAADPVNRRAVPPTTAPSWSSLEGS